MKIFPRLSLACLFFLLLVACAPATPAPQQDALVLHYTFSVQPWLEEVYACAGLVAVYAEQRSAAYLDLQAFDLAIRIGDTGISSPLYQVGTEDIIVIANPHNPVDALTAGQVRSLFTGAIQNWESITGHDAPVQVWVFSDEEDIQGQFEAAALSAAPVTSLARLASGPEEMLRAVAQDGNAVGILTRSLATDQVSTVYTAASLPVLVLLPHEPSQAALEITRCLQK